MVLHHSLDFTPVIGKSFNPSSLSSFFDEHEALMINQQGCEYVLPENRISCLNLVMWLITILSTLGVSSAVISND